jgi:outer membrane protein TolC
MPSIRNFLSRTATAAVTLCVALGATALSAPLAAEAAAKKGETPPRRELSLDEAVATALSKDLGVIGANLDWLSASAKAESASWKRLPSLTTSLGYTRLSDLQSSLNLGPVIGDISFGSLDNLYSFSLNMQYPIFAGFRVKENIAISSLQAESKDASRETIRRSLVFDVRKAYWEAVRATRNRSVLDRNLELMKQNGELADRQFAQGVATRADQLAARMRLEQSIEDSGDARALQKHAFLALAALTGEEVASLGISTATDDAPLPFELTTKPDDAALPETAAVDEKALVQAALARRPETRSAELARAIALHAVELSRAALYPTVAVTGNYVYADPNQRVAFQSDPYKFTGTWALGLQLSYDIGGVPAALDDIKAQSLAASKARADEDKQRRTVALDVENCIVSLERARRDLASTAAMLDEANENLRVAEGRVAAGTAKDIDLNSSRFDLLRSEFAVTNRRIDLLIALADLARATASEDLK